jgi:hypothetical protein
MPKNQMPENWNTKSDKFVPIWKVDPSQDHYYYMKAGFTHQDKLHLLLIAKEWITVIHVDFWNESLEETIFEQWCSTSVAVQN